MAIINADGLFKENKKHIFICAFTNLFLSIILVKYYGIDGVLIGTVIAFFINILLKSSLVARRVFKNVKMLDVLKYYIISTVLFVLLAIILKPIESLFLSTSIGFIMTVLKLGLLFVLVIVVASLILYAISGSARNLFARMFRLVKSKIKK